MQNMTWVIEFGTDRSNTGLHSCVAILQFFSCHH